MIDKIYDLVIIGGGPAGLTAGIYTSRYKLDTLLLAGQPGGIITDAHRVCNYPGEPEISGSKLADKMINHAKKYGTEIQQEMVTSVKKTDKNFEIKTMLGNQYRARTVLLATGTERRKLGLEKEEKLTGNGVSYCATCDGNFFENDRVAVIGGSDAAATAALYLSNIASEVFIIYRRDQLRAVPSWRKEIENTDNIKVIYNTTLEKLLGEESLEGVKLSQKYKGGNKLKIDGLFIEIGSEPDTEFADSLGIKTTEKGYIDVTDAQRTDVNRIWAAGDATNASNKFKQVITSAAEGAIAANDIYHSINKLKK